MNNQSLPTSDTHFLAKIKPIYNHARKKNYIMAYNSNNNLIFTTILFLIREFQILALLSIKDNQSLLKSIRNIPEFFQFLRVFILRFPAKQETKVVFSIYISLILFIAQLSSVILYLLPCYRKEINGISSKIFTTFSIILPIPTTSYLFSMIFNFNSQIQNIVSLIIVIFTFILMILNQIVYVNFHFQFSLKAVSQNILARLPNVCLYKEFGWIIFACIQQIAQNYGYPNLFVVYLSFTLIFGIYEVKIYAIGFQYFDNRMNRNLGVLSTMNCTISLAVIFSYLKVNLFINGMTTFIIAFFLFFANFLVTFKKFWLKKILIDDHTTTQITQITYVITFILFFTDISHKREKQTYISSLLKNHCNNCNNLNCCCKNRNTIYDPKTNSIGNTNNQPHLDSVFIKHYYLKMINESIVQFPKSLNLKILLGLFYLEFLEQTPQCIKQIKYFNKKSIYDKLNLQQKHALYCMESQFYEFIGANNELKGNKKIEKVKLFDEFFNLLVKKIVATTENLLYFWQVLNSLSHKNQSKNRINPHFFSIISSKTLNLMQQVEQTYQQMRHINSMSNQLRQLMFFYSKQVVTDMDLFTRIKENLKLEKVNAKELANQNKKLLNLYGPSTANLVISGINKIIWVSNNARSVFGYRKNYYLLQTSINNLMPEYFAKNHDALVKSWLQTGRCRKMNKATTIWCRKQNGSCFRANIYIKVMPNFVSSTEKDIQYYTSIQNIGKNDIVCGNDGEIYACDHNFQWIMKCPIKNIQSYKPNIQIFFPSLFPHFFSYFFKEEFEHKAKQQERCSGYIPDKIVNFMQYFSKQKYHFIRKNKKSKYFQVAYALYLQTKMQQITMQLKGRYFTVNFQTQRMDMLGRQLIILKINKVQMDTVQNYYNEFENILKILEQMKEKTQTKKQLQTLNKKVLHYSISSNPLEMFFNAKKLKKLNDGVKIQKVEEVDCLDRRKKRAMNQLARIKSQRVRQTIFRVKRALFENKILSANTYKILTQNAQKQENKTKYIRQEQQQGYNVLNKISMDSKRRRRARRSSIPFFQDEDKNSDQQLISEANSSTETQNQLSNGKGKETVSFEESTTSSAAFISLSTKIRFLKEKLRGIHAKKLLVLTYILFALVFLTINSANIYSTFQEIYQVDKANITEEQLLSTYRLTESLMTEKSLLTFSSYLQSQQENQTNYIQFLEHNSQISSILRLIAYYELLKNIEIGKKLQNYGLSLNYLYINLTNTDHQVEGKLILMRDFLLKQYKLLDRGQPSQSILEYHQIIMILNEMIQIPNIRTVAQNIYYFLIIFFVVKMLVFFNLYKAETKIQVITQLISQLYPHQKQKYLKNFTKLHHKIGMMLKMINLVENKQHKNRKQERANKEAFGEFMERQEKSKDKNGIINVCWKILGTFGIIYVALVVQVLLLDIFFKNIANTQYQFDALMINKLNLTYKMMNLQTTFSTLQQNQLNNITNENDFLTKLSHINDINISLPNKLINLYNNHSNDAQLSGYLQQFSTGNLCGNIQKLLPISSNLTQICQSVNNGMFIDGTFNSFSYIDQSISYYSQNPTQYIQSISNISTLIEAFSINSLLTLQLINNFYVKKYQFHNMLILITLIVTIIFLIISIFMMALWRYVYLQIAKRGSMYNCYLLVLPFEVLMENPYIRQYLKMELEYKYSAY